MKKYLIEIFYVLTASMIIFSIMELIFPRIILAYFNINWLLIFWLLNGMVILIFNKNEIDN